MSGSGPSAPSLSCAACNKAPPEVNLKQCAKCPGSPIRYCSRDCQKADWKAHKKICGKPGQEGTAGTAGATGASSAGRPAGSSGLRSPARGLEAPVEKPFTRLQNGTWLHDRPEKDVYRLLLDAYRMRVEDDYTHGGEITPGSLYAGAPDGLAAFRRFMGRVASRPGLLPAWWNAEKLAACEQLGMDPDEWCGLRCSVEKHDIIDHYGDSLFPMQLRMFAEAVYGRGPGGANGAFVLRAMAMQER